MNGKKFHSNEFARFLLQAPERITIFGFMILIIVGAGLLMMPVASTGDKLGFIDALFTSTSASCVTGLAVIDTGSGLSVIGQFILLFLIQAGGLGIMTISTLFVLIMGWRPGMTERIIIEDTFTHSGGRRLTSILKDVILFALVIEGIGAFLLFFKFIQENGVDMAFHLSIFHSVSAFCNAGFSLFPDSFSRFCEDWFLNLVICFLVIAGGLGFLVLAELKRNFPFKRRTWTRFSLHTKIVLSATGWLLFGGTLLILVMEWNNTLAGMSIPSRFLASFFQSVSARTAGFNTLPFGSLANETLFTIMLLMFIGACPGSCGGGIKTTTFATLFHLGLSRLRGLERPQIFYRTIPDAGVGKATSIFMVSMVIVTIGTMILLMAEVGDMTHNASRGKFLELFFEVVSAFGTAGLSTGITGDLSNAGKLIITFLMFAGRLGPLVLAVAISRRQVARYHYAEENIMVG